MTVGRFVATIGFVLDLIADRASLAEEALDAGYSRAGTSRRIPRFG